jgi:NADH dehydrogenase
MHLADAMNADPEVEIVLVDAHNFHLFTPLLTTVSAGLIDSQHVAYPIRRMERVKPFLFRESEVTGIDLQGKTVTLAKDELSYDYLVISLGSVTNFFGMKEVERLAFPFKSMGDAIRLRNRVIEMFEQAAWEPDPERKRQLLTFVFCGAGATGVELAAAIHDFIANTLIEEHPTITLDDVNLILMEASERILPALSAYMSTVSHNKLLSKGVDVRTGTRITQVRPTGHDQTLVVETEDGQIIPTGTLVWTAGIQANPLVSALPVDKGRGGSVVVDEHLMVPGFPGVYALGDNASVRNITTGKPLPPDAKVAVRLAESVAKNIANDLRGQPQTPFQYEHPGDLVSLGTNAAVAEIKGVRLSGFPAFVLWRSFYFWRLLGFESKARIAWDYLYGMFAERDTAQTELVC